MGVRRWGTAAVAGLFLLTGCTGDDGGEPPAPAGRTGSPAPRTDLARRPLELPAVTPGGRCPVAAVTHRPEAPAHSRDVLGDGPLAPVSGYFGRAATLELRADDRDKAGGYRKKVRWYAFDYTGPVLIRAARIDGRGQARVEFSYTGESTAAGFTAEVSARGATQDFPATTLVDGPGCYAYQVDTAEESWTVVFAAARAR